MDSIVERLRYSGSLGQQLISEALQSCPPMMGAYGKFLNRYLMYGHIASIFGWQLTPKAGLAFSQYNQNNENIVTKVTKVFNDTIPLIVNASSMFSIGFSKAIANNNLSLIARYQNCSKSLISEFDGFAELFLQKSPKCLKGNLNFARVDDLLVEIFLGWSELYSGVAGCCSLAKNRNPPTTPPKMADRYLGSDTLATRCLEKVRKPNHYISTDFEDYLISRYPRKYHPSVSFIQ